MVTKLPDHKRGERVEIRWPGGPYDFVIEFDYARDVGHWDGWLELHGTVVEPSDPGHHAYRGFYCHPVGEGVYEMIPKQG